MEDKIYEINKNNSIGNNKKTSLSKIKRKSFNKGFIAAAIAVLIIAGAININDKINELKEPKASFEIEYSQIVAQATQRTSDRNDYFYNTDKIAKEIIEEPEKMDMKLYFVYKTINTNSDLNKESKTKNLDNIVSSMNNLLKDSPKINTFNDYLIKNGFQENDNPSIEKYNKYWNNMIEAEKLKESNDLNQKGGASK
jgi:hypothetical protein